MSSTLATQDFLSLRSPSLHCGLCSQLKTRDMAEVTNTNPSDSIPCKASCVFFSSTTVCTQSLLTQKLHFMKTGQFDLSIAIQQVELYAVI